MVASFNLKGPERDSQESRELFKIVINWVSEFCYRVGSILKAKDKLIVELENKLAQKEEELNLKNKELEAEKVRRIIAENNLKTLLMVVFHETRTPLNIIKGYCEFLMEEFQNNEPNKIYLANICISCSDLIRILDNIGELMNNDPNLDYTYLEIVDLTEKLKRITKGQAELKAISLNIVSSLKSVTTDYNKILKIVYELTSNAIKFSKNGSQVKINFYSKGDFFYIEVIDSGIGIDPKDFSKIFDKCTQIDSSVGRMYEGVGNGLFIAKKFAELLGGDISVKSEEGKGSIFTVKIPFIHPKINDIIN